jgi:UDP-GlcNAc:undecaprenyl-phosphate GlcNAc-1-phosphate transferase
VREYLFVLVVAAATTLLLIGPVGALAGRLGAVPPTRERDVHRFPIPRLGGLAMLAGLLAALAAASALPRLGRVFELSTDARGILLAAVIICLLGVADDVWNLDALTKFAGQVVAAGVMVLSGVQLYWLPLPSGPLVLTSEMAVGLTVLTVLVTVNAVNFVDGLDGLAAGVVGIGAAAFFSYSYLLAVVEGLSRMTLPALVSAALAGICLGFLPANVHPARIFMGDSGSMLIGLLLAGSAISLTGQLDPEVLPGEAVLPALLPLLLPVAVIAIPFLDLLAAVWRRTRAGRSPFAPDKQHLHHRLLDLGHSHRRAVTIMWVWAALVAFGLVVVALVGGAATVVTVALAVIGLVLLTLGRPVGLVGRAATTPVERQP